MTEQDKKMIEITIENFEEEVMLASMQKPILVSFWSPTCGPCQTLAPILEGLEQEYAGRFMLAKIDTSTQPQLAQAFGIRAVPTTFLLVNGQPVDGFSGAVPKEQIQALLDQYVPSEDEVAAEANKEEAASLAASGQADEALSRLETALATNPNDEKARAQYVELLIQAGRIDDAEAAWMPLGALISAGGALAARPIALQVWLDAIRACEQGVNVSDLQAKIEANKRDFGTRFQLAQYHLMQGERTEALDELLEILMRDKTWNDGAARQAYVGILELLTPAQPTKVTTEKKSAIELQRQVQALDPQQQLVADYRRRLSMVLN